MRFFRNFNCFFYFNLHNMQIFRFFLQKNRICSIFSNISASCHNETTHAKEAYPPPLVRMTNGFCRGADCAPLHPRNRVRPGARLRQAEAGLGSKFRMQSEGPLRNE